MRFTPTYISSTSKRYLAIKDKPKISICERCHSSFCVTFECITQKPRDAGRLRNLEEAESQRQRYALVSGNSGGVLHHVYKILKIALLETNSRVSFEEIQFLISGYYCSHLLYHNFCLVFCIFLCISSYRQSCPLQVNSPEEGRTADSSKYRGRYRRQDRNCGKEDENSNSSNHNGPDKEDCKLFQIKYEGSA